MVVQRDPPLEFRARSLLARQDEVDQVPFDLTVAQDFNVRTMVMVMGVLKLSWVDDRYKYSNKTQSGSGLLFCRECTSRVRKRG